MMPKIQNEGLRFRRRLVYHKDKSIVYQQLDVAPPVHFLRQFLCDNEAVLEYSVWEAPGTRPSDAKPGLELMMN